MTRRASATVEKKPLPGDVVELLAPGTSCWAEITVGPQRWAGLDKPLPLIEGEWRWPAPSPPWRPGEVRRADLRAIDGRVICAGLRVMVFRPTSRPGYDWICRELPYEDSPIWRPKPDPGREGRDLFFDSRLPSRLLAPPPEESAPCAGIPCGLPYDGRGLSGSWHATTGVSEPIGGRHRVFCSQACFDRAIMEDEG